MIMAARQRRCPSSPQALGSGPAAATLSLRTVTSAMARRGHVRDLGLRTRTWWGSCHCPYQAFPSDLMRFVDFGDEWREGGS